jgi:hypothetical protein
MSKSGNGTMNEESVKITRMKHMPLKYRAQPFLTPWAIMVAVFVTSLVTHQWASGPVPLVCLAAMGPGLGWVTWETWGRRHEHARNAATAFVVGMGAWLALATATGPLTRGMIWTMIFGGSFLCLSWNIRYAGITPTNKHDGVKTGPVDSIAEVKGLKNTVTSKVKRIADKAGERVEILLNHPGGRNTTADVRKRRDNIAGLHTVGPDNVRVSEVDGRGDQTKVTVRLVNPTTDIVTYPGLSAPGKSVADSPLRTGVREDGAESGHWITGNDNESRAASATLYTGMTGAGKTEAYILAALEMVSRTDCAPPIVADPEKFMLSFGHIMEFLDLAADGPEQTGQLVSNLPDAMRYRASLLGSLGFHKGWTPEAYRKHGIPVQPIHVEEAAGYLAGSPAFQKAITLCRALGMPLSASLQVAGYKQMDRAVRSQFGNSLAFGVRERLDAQFALLDETLRAGADPSRWGNNHPGRHVAEATGIPSEQWSMTHRTFKISEDETVATFELCRSAGWAKCDPGTFGLLSKGIERPQRMIVQVPDWKSADVTPTLDLSEIVPQAEQVRPTFEMIKGGALPEMDHDDQSVHAMIADRIEELEASGVTELTKDDFEDLPFERDRTWIFKAMSRQVKIGRLRRLPGKGARYEIIPAAAREEG